MLHKGHMRDHLVIHKNLHRWCNIDSEAHLWLTQINTSYLIDVREMDTKKALMEKDTRKNSLPILLCASICDVSAVHRLDKVKEEAPEYLRVRDIFTGKDCHFKYKVPKTYVHDTIYI
jgi:hypothetical protein